MTTQCTPVQMEFQGLGKRRVVAEFTGGRITSDAGVLLLREVDLRLGACGRFARCFTDHRDRTFVEHRVEELIRQRVLALAQGYEDLNDHDRLRDDALLAAAAGKTDPLGQGRRQERDRGHPGASRSTLNRMELAPRKVNYTDPQKRYFKLVHDERAIEELFITLFVEAHTTPPEEVILDFDATDDPLHGMQEGRHFHGYYDSYCYLPLYVFSGPHLLVARLRTADREAADGAGEVLAWRVARLRAHWPEVRLGVRADSGFARDDLMSRCESTPNLYYLLGLAKNERLLEYGVQAMTQAQAQYQQTQESSRVFTEFAYRTRRSWSRERRVVMKAEHGPDGANPRFVVTNLPQDAHPAPWAQRYTDPQTLYERVYCARGDMENRIKEQQLDLFADRTSTHTLRANQLRLWFSSLAYVLMTGLKRLGLQHTRLKKATCGTIRTRLLKLGAAVEVSVRRVVARLSSVHPYQDVFEQAWRALQAYPLRC